jgi:hypothetical protein
LLLHGTLGNVELKALMRAVEDELSDEVVQAIDLTRVKPWLMLLRRSLCQNGLLHGPCPCAQRIAHPARYRSPCQHHPLFRMWYVLSYPVFLICVLDCAAYRYKREAVRITQHKDAWLRCHAPLIVSHCTAALATNSQGSSHTYSLASTAFDTL